MSATQRRLVTPPPQSDPLLLSVREAAVQLGVGRNTLYSLVHEGRIRAVRINNRYLISRVELAAFVEREEGGVPTNGQTANPR